MNIAVVGTGYVGLVTGACFAEFGVNVTCLDIDEEKIGALQEGKIPIFETGLEDLVERNTEAGRLAFSTDIPEGIRDSLVIFIAVGTPEKEDGSADLSYVRDVAQTIGENLNDYKVVVSKSTVPVGTGKMIREVIEDRRKGNTDFSIVSNPEFLREGSAVEDFQRPDRVVIGTEDEDERAVEIMKELYSPLYLIEVPFVITNVESSEMIKYASNAFLATKISFINEIADICDETGADVHQVANAMGLDGRIGSKFLRAGAGFGGSCFPKDTKALKDIAADCGQSTHIVDAAVRVNKKRPERMVEKITGQIGDPEGKTVGVLGLSFKPNTDDIREAPSLKIIDILKKKGAGVKAYDPQAMDNARKKIDVEFCESEYEAADGSDALVIVTEWNQFRSLDLSRIKELLNEPVLIDMRNIYEPEEMEKQGFRYCAVGRGI